MFYKHNNFGGRIQQSGSESYNPSGLTGEAKDTGFAFGVNNTPTVDAVTASGAAVPVDRHILKVRELQKLFLDADGKVPIHLVRGTRDLIPYRATLGLCIGGFFYYTYVMYKMAYGIK